MIQYEYARVPANVWIHISEGWYVVMSSTASHVMKRQKLGNVRDALVLFEEYVQFILY
jgi:hypothetical protein